MLIRRRVVRRHTRFTPCSNNKGKFQLNPSGCFPSSSWTKSSPLLRAWILPTEAPCISAHDWAFVHFSCCSTCKLAVHSRKFITIHARCALIIASMCNILSGQTLIHPKSSIKIKLVCAILSLWIITLHRLEGTTIVVLKQQQPRVEKKRIGCCVGSSRGRIVAYEFKRSIAATAWARVYQHTRPSSKIAQKEEE